MSHTKEPWVIGKHGAVLGGPVMHYTNGSGQNQIVMTTGAEWMEPDEKDANARRIVACVNACAGIRTECLEQRGMIPVTALEKQRDELLAALEDAEAGLLFLGADKQTQSGDFVPTGALALRTVRVAIDSVKGGA